MTDVSTCADCGARLTPGADRCDLCGAPQGAAPPAEPGPTLVPTQKPGVFCNACGWKNPPGSRFCSQCGTSLQDVKPGTGRGTEPPVAVGARAPSSGPVGRTLGVVLGVSVLLVVALFVITALSTQGTGGTAQAPSNLAPQQPAAEATAAPVFAALSAEQEASVAELEQTIDAASGAERAAKLREMVNLLVGFGRPDLAAQAQEDLARADATADAWTRAGDLYFEWLRVLEDRGENPTPVALRAIPAYEASLAEQDNPDVRVRLAWAYQYDPQNPMKAIEETRAVLDRDSTHVGATYNYAFFLMRIGRVDQAITQMQRVKRLAGADSVLVRHADAFITALRESQP